jgi:hypothetical protein
VSDEALAALANAILAEVRRLAAQAGMVAYSEIRAPANVMQQIED